MRKLISFWTYGWKLVKFPAFFLLVFFFLGFDAGAMGPPREPTFGFSFSAPYAESFGLDPRGAYVELLDSFDFQSVRIPVYWNRVYQEGTYDFSEVDFLVKEAKKRGLEVVLSFGYRNFRWPECHAPTEVLAKDNSAFEKELSAFNQAVLDHYAPTDLVDIWQVENEPLLHPHCRRLGFRDALNAIDQIKYSDEMERPVMLTFGGIGLTAIPFTWKLTEGADIIGVSFYPRILDPLFRRHYIETFNLGLFSPRGIRREREFVEGRGKRFWVVESQAEPWAGDPRTMSPEILQSNLEQLLSYGGAEKTFLWGAEWWLKEKEEGRPELFESAQELINLPSS